MTDSDHPGGFNRTDASMHELVDALNTLRDKLLDVAMALRDYQFETDKAQRSSAGEATSELIDRVNALPR